MMPEWAYMLGLALTAVLAAGIAAAGAADETLEEKRNEEIGGRRHGRR